MAISVDSCVVALLGRDDGARAQLRQALEELGARVAFEAEPASVTPDRVLGAGPNVVIVNLEEGADDAIDHLQAMFERDDLNVIFNDADVSRSLEGWDLARWARHLAAKVLGHDNTMPPPPEGAEPLPDRDFFPLPGAVTTPAQHIAADGAMLEAFRDEAAEQVDAIPADGLVASSADQGATPPDAAAAAEALSIDAFSLEQALGLEDVPAPERLSSTPEVVVQPVAVEEAVETDMTQMFSLAESEGLPESPGSATDAGDTPLADAEVADVPMADEMVDFDWDSDLPEVTADAVADPEGDASSEAGVAGFDAAAWSLDDATAGTDVDAGEVDADLAALAAQFDAMEAATPEIPPAESLDFSAFDMPVAEDIGGELPQVPEADDVASGSDTVAAAPDAKRLLDAAGMLSLVIDDDSAAEGEVAVPEESKPSFDFSILGDLSLAPLEGEGTGAPVDAAPEPVVPMPVLEDETPATLGADAEPQIDPLLMAMGLVDAPAEAASPPSGDGGILHVVVLGASIGGPDALRSFLGALPQGAPAVFLLVQHLESGYFERLAQQLQKSSNLPVKVAEAGMQARPGEVLVVPAAEKVVLEADGRVVFSPHEAVPRYTPSIDDVLRDVADRFGARALGIIFSGMAGDAVEGAVYLTGKGGQIWAQDPASCVVSSMVDGARSRGVVEFTGSPRELAQRCAAVIKQ